MKRKLTITLPDDVYRGLYRRIGRGKMSHFIERLVRPYVVDEIDLVAGYTEMAADTEREEEAREWIECSPTQNHWRGIGMKVVAATLEDIPGWLVLAAEVEFLFGQMLNSPEFQRALERNILRRTALCIREADGPPGAPLMGALMFSLNHLPHYHINWLAVAERSRRRGVGRALMQPVVDLVQPPADLSLVTFGPDIAAGQPARRFYERLGFSAAEPAPNGPDGGSRQVFRRVFEWCVGIESEHLLTYEAPNLAHIDFDRDLAAEEGEQ
jgi:GNAT superfamily N-acetyltransferase